MFNLPNIITLSRIALVVVLTLVLALWGDGPFAGNVSAEYAEYVGWWFVPVSTASCVALWAFVVASVSDFFDGYLARRYNLVTNFGKLIDPLADKVLVSAAYIYLTYVGMCPFWICIIIIFREFLVTGLRQLAVGQQIVIPANNWGKWKTGTQLVFCIACFAHLAYGPNLPEPLHSLSVGGTGMWFRSIFMWLSLALTVWSGVFYCWQYRGLFK